MRQYTEAFKALSDGTRLRILRLLALKKKELCCCEIADSLDEPIYNVSRHLKILIRAGLARDRKEGRWVYFSLPPNPPLFAKEIFRIVVSIHAPPRMKKDLENLERRFLLRENGKCLQGVQKKRLLKGRRNK